MNDLQAKYFFKTEFKNINDDQILYLDQNGNVLAIYKQKDGKLKMWKMLYKK